MRRGWTCCPIKNGANDDGTAPHQQRASRPVRLRGRLRNGGGIQGQGFRLDIDGDDISDDDLSLAIIEDLRLLMVSEVRILNKQFVREPHKRSRTRPEAAGADRLIRIDLSHTVEEGMVR